MTLPTLPIAAGFLIGIACAGCGGGRTISVPEMHLIRRGEPGQRMTVLGTIRSADGATPIARARIEVSQADAEGIYARGPDGTDLGRTEARLRGRIHSDSDGSFSIFTIRPGGCPGSGVPANIHFRVSAPGYKEKDYTIYLDGDLRMTDVLRNRLRGQPATDVRPVLPRNDGTLVLACDIQLER